jgi:hypothetical protein
MVPIGEDPISGKEISGGPISATAISGDQISVVGTNGRGTKEASMTPVSTISPSTGKDSGSSRTGTKTAALGASGS